MSNYESPIPDEATPLPQTLHHAFGVAVFSILVLVVYVPAQVALCFFLAPNQHHMKLMIEPYLLLLGVILHIQWRRVGRTFLAEDYPRPIWIVAADCVSFVTTFTAFYILIEAFLREAKII
jgi:hypothetical protein